MNKKDIQKRVLQKGKPLALNKFSWDEKTRTFSTEENNLVLDFEGIDRINFITGSYCTFNAGSDCTFNTDSFCTFNTGSYCTFSTDHDCTFKTGYTCTFNTDSFCTFNTGSYCTFNAGSNCTFSTGYDCTFNTGYDCTFSTGSHCTFSTDSFCTFNTDSFCTFSTGSHCTFSTDSFCTFNTGTDCTFSTGTDCVVVRRDTFEIIQLKENVKIQIAPYGIKGYVSEGVYSETGNPAIIADYILSEVLSKKTSENATVYKVLNYDEDKPSYLLEVDGVYSHGETLKEAKESFMYKISDRDTSEYKDYDLDTELSKEEAIKMYRKITGACEAGTKYFVDSLGKDCPEKATVKELLDITKGQYNNQKLVEFFKK